MEKQNKTIESFTIGKIDRAMLKNAEYNPRKISQAAEKKLKKSLKDFGLLRPIIWNKTTGNIVGGHQTLKSIDAIMKAESYQLTVAIVEMSIEDEVKANIVLNNPSAMGEWDNELLADIKNQFPSIDFANDLGFDKFDIDLIFQGTEFESQTFPEYQKQEEIKTEAQKMADLDVLKAKKKEHREQVNAANAEGESFEVANDGYLLTFAFPSNSECEAAVRKLGELPGTRYIKHTKLYDIQDGKYKLYGPDKSLDS